MFCRQLLMHIEQHGFDKLISFLGLKSLHHDAAFNEEGVAIVAVEQCQANNLISGQVIYEILVAHDDKAILHVTVQSLYSEHEFSIELDDEMDIDEALDTGTNDITRVAEMSHARSIVEQFKNIHELNLMHLNVSNPQNLNQFFEL